MSLRQFAQGAIKAAQRAAGIAATYRQGTSLVGVTAIPARLNLMTNSCAPHVTIANVSCNKDWRRRILLSKSLWLS